MAGLTITAAGTYDGAGATVDFITAIGATGEIIIKNYVVEGTEATHIHTTSYDFSLTAAIMIDSCETVEISNCYVTSTDHHLEGSAWMSGVGIWVERTTTVTIHNSYAKSSYYDGIDLYQCGTSVVRDSYTEGGTGRDGLDAWECGTVTITNNIIDGSVSGYADAMDIWDITNLSILNNTLVGGDVGIYLSEITNSLTINNNIFYGQALARDYAIDIDTCCTPSISNNSFYGWTWNYYNGDLDGEMPDPPNSVTADPLFASSSTYSSYANKDYFPNGYFLSQIAAGEASDSPCVDAGTGTNGAELGTTRTDFVADSGNIDIGFHYPPGAGLTTGFVQCIFGRLINFAGARIRRLVPTVT